MQDEAPIPSRFQRNVCWAALSGLALLTIVILIVTLALGLGYLFIALEAVLLPVIIAGILAYLLSPCVQWVQKYVKKRFFSVLLVLLSAGLIVGGLAATIIPPLAEQTGELVTKRDEIYASAVSTGKDMLTNPIVQSGVDMLYNKALKEAAADGLDENPSFTQASTYEQKVLAVLNFNSSYLVEQVLTWLTAGSRAISSLVTIIIGSVMVPVFLFYFLLESESIVNNWHDILPLRRSRFRIEVVETLQEINGYIVSFVRGQMLVSLIDGMLLGIALKIMGLPYAITIAAAAALIGIIPYIGMILTSIPAMAIAWFTWHDPTYVLGVGAIFLCVSQFDGWVIQPRIVGNRVGMHDFTVMFSVLFWGIVFGGIIGALIAVPLTASIKVLFSRYVWASFKKNQLADHLHEPLSNKAIKSKN